jgi:hypothetical protein
LGHIKCQWHHRCQHKTMNCRDTVLSINNDDAQC